MHTVSIIIPHYRTLPYLENCIPAIIKNTIYPIKELLIVNDGSPDGRRLAQYIAGARQEANFNLRLINRTDNRGFAYTCNQGASHAKGEYLLFLNADTIPQSGWLNAMVSLMHASEETGIVGSRLIYTDRNLIQHIGGVFDGTLFPFHVYCAEPAFLPFLNKDRTLQWATAASFLIRRREFERLNGFDIQYVSYCEDVDLCFNMRLNLGKKVVVAADSFVYHFEGVTGMGRQFASKNHARFLKRWGSHARNDEYEIYENDGFSREFVALIEQVNSRKSFALAYALRGLLSLESLEKQAAYSREKGVKGLIKDLNSLARKTSPLLFRHYPMIQLQMRASGWRDVRFEHFSASELFSLIGSDKLSDKAHGTIRREITKRLDAASYFLLTYNLASLAQSKGDAERAQALYRLVSDLAHDVDRSLAGRAHFKLALLAPDKREKIDHLKQCLRLYPAHNSARLMLQEAHEAQKNAEE